MKHCRLVLLAFLLDLYALSGMAASHIWEFNLLSDWHEQDGTVYGKALKCWYWYNDEDSYSTVDVNGKTYFLFHIEEQAYITMSGAAAPRRYRNGFELPIRKEGGCVYTPYADYLAYLQQAGGTFGNADYIPYHVTDDGQEFILYDYNMEVDDAYRFVEGYEDVSVTAKDVVTLDDGQEHRLLTLSNGLVLIEDIGCINSCGMLFDYLNPISYQQEYYAFLGCMKVGGDLYDNEGEVIYTNNSVNYIDTTDYLRISESNISIASQGGTFDLQGRRLTAKPRHGLYIQGGRKYVVR